MPNPSLIYLYTLLLSLEDNVMKTLDTFFPFLSKENENCAVNMPQMEIMLYNIIMFGKDKYFIDPLGKTRVVQARHHQGAIIDPL